MGTCLNHLPGRYPNYGSESNPVGPGSTMDNMPTTKARLPDKLDKVCSRTLPKDQVPENCTVLKLLLCQQGIRLRIFSAQKVTLNEAYFSRVSPPMGCASSITTTKLTNQHPDIQINVIEPSTVVSTGTHQDTPSSTISTRQMPRFKTSNALQVADVKMARRCHSAFTGVGNSNKVFCETRQQFSQCSRNDRSSSLPACSRSSGRVGWKSAEKASNSTNEDVLQEG
nr:PREDICTED: uncharacterized protein LOC106703535 [Latimeria chalumnae]|eukprot:XP_014344075.1 PREDICTED: uncharacterized protein LOC106703535 [Latimeria chalumnae]